MVLVKIKHVSREKKRTCFAVSLSTGAYLESRVSKMTVEVLFVAESCLLISGNYQGTENKRWLSSGAKGRALH